jgi:predicted permease
VTNFLVIFVGLAGGYFLRKVGRVPPGAPVAINAWILNIAMPAVILLYVPHIRWSVEALFPLTVPLVIIGGAGLWAALVSKVGRWSPGDRTAVFLTAGLGNTSFVGFPLILAYYGSGALPVGVLADQASFFLLATVGIGAAAHFRSVEAPTSGVSLGRTIAGRLFTFPPLLTFPVALLWPQDWGLAGLEPLLTALGATLAPLALFAVGIQLSFSQARKGGDRIALGLAYKLFLAPAVVLGLGLALGLRGEVLTISVFEAAMAPMITSAVVAAEFGASPRLANAMVGVGIPLSLVTTAGWWWLLGLVS